jgi:RecB family exonuclease
MSNESALLDMMRRAGNYFGALPTVWSWSEMYNRLVPRERRRRCIDPPDHNLVLKFVLDRALAELDSRGVQVPDGVRRRGFIDILSAAIKEIILEDVPPDRILSERPEPAADRLTGRDLLYRLYTEYLIYLGDNGLADNAQLPSLTADEISVRKPAYISDKTIRWVGFMSFTGAQLKLVFSLRRLGVNMEFYTPDPGTGYFRDAASQLGLEAEPISSDAVRAATLTASDSYEQFDCIAREIAKRTSDEPGLDVGILVAPEHTQVLETALEKHGIPSQRRSEVTVDLTAVTDVARRAWELHRLGWPPLRTMHLLRNPLFGISLDAGRIRRDMPEGLEMWEKFLESDERALRVLSRLGEFCSCIAREGGGSAEEILRALYAIADDGEWERRLSMEAGPDCDLDPAVREVASSRLEIAQKLAMLQDLRPALGEASSVRFAKEDAIGFITDWGREAATALPPVFSGAVSIYDAPPPVLASHSLWIIADASSSRYPGPPSDQALVDESVREHVNGSSEDYVHLPTLHEKRQQKEAIFRRLLALGEDLTIVARPEADAGGHALSDSPFMSPESFREGSGWVLAGKIECKGGNPASMSAAGRGSFPRFAVSARTPGDAARIRMSDADRLVGCPFAYWCERIAGLTKETEPDDILDRMTLGNIMHEVWRRVWRKFSPDEQGGSLAVAVNAEWDAAVPELCAKYPLLSDRRSGSALEDLKNKMTAAAAVQDDIEARARDAGLVRSRTETEFVLPRITLENAALYGRADRIDFWARPGREIAVLIDYKLSSAEKDSLQLALYATAMMSAGVTVGGFCYVNHADATLQGVWSDELKGIYRRTRGSTFDARVETAAEALALIDGIAGSGRYEANYDSPLCGKCDFQGLCRRSEHYGEFSGHEDETDE